MASKSLTRAAVEALAYREGGPQKQILWDTKLRRFGCRATPEGGKQYVILYRISGRQRLMSLGPRIEDFPTVEAARTRARKLLGLADDGIDPMAERERMADAETLTALWSVYETEHIARLSANSRRAMSSAWACHVAPAIGDLSPGQVTQADVIRIHDKATKKGAKVAANRAVQRLRAALNWLYARNPKQFPSDWRNPAQSVKYATGTVKLNKESPRKEILDLEQQHALLVSLAEEPDPWARAYLEIELRTGCRVNEMLSLLWSDLDLDKGFALIQRSAADTEQRKNGEDLQIPLSPLTISLLRALPVTESPYVFPSPRKPGKPYTSNAIRRRYNAALRRAGLPHRTLRDLRRSYGTNMARRGGTSKQIATLLGNSAEITSEVYIQLAAEDLRRITTQNDLDLLPASQS